jgi:hypothetical protein
MRPFIGILSISTKPVDIILSPQPRLNRLFFLIFEKIIRKCLSINHLQQKYPVSN